MNLPENIDPARRMAVIPLCINMHKEKVRIQTKAACRRSH